MQESSYVLLLVARYVFQICNLSLDAYHSASLQQLHPQTRDSVCKSASANLYLKLIETHKLIQMLYLQVLLLSYPTSLFLTGLDA